MPKRYTEAQLVLPSKLNLVLVNGRFQNALKGCFRYGLGVEQAEAVLFDGEPLHVAAFEIHDESHFFCTANGDAKLGILQLPKRLGEWIDAHAEASFFE